MKQKTVFIVASVVLLLVFVFAVVFYTAGKKETAVQVVTANRSALVRMHSPTIGPATAPVEIVEFLDPACETCSAFYPRVKQLIAAHPERIRLVLRYAPFHNGSDKVVAVLEAARRQGKFWPALEALLATQASWAPQHTPQVGLVWKHLEGLGLSHEQMMFDLSAPEIATLIGKDLADAQTLGVTMTPEFFVNGKPLPSFGFEQLEALVNAELAAAPR